MGYYAFLEVSNGETLRILRPDGIIAGKTLLNFENIYNGFGKYLDEESQEHQWFSKLESLAKTEISILKNVMYPGEWDYGEHEYARFKQDFSSSGLISEEDFQKSVRAVNNMWQPIDKMILVVQDLLRIFPEMGENETYWFWPNDTPIEFQGLLNTLLLAKERGGDEVRIRVY
ncbi:MAG: hypothetical protein JXB38_03570 [Anaerolineales bacterium]|nr:hypothetical protein [Anaerolineales bacterium]